MVDARDLKSLGTKCRAGSIPAPGTSNESLQTIKLKAFFMKEGRAPKKFLLQLRS